MSEGLKLNQVGHDIVKHGGADHLTDDEMLFLEVVKRAPGMSIQDVREMLIALRVQYGQDALRAIKTGHVQFELVTPRT